MFGDRSCFAGCFVFRCRNVVENSHDFSRVFFAFCVAAVLVISFALQCSAPLGSCATTARCCTATMLPGKTRSSGVFVVVNWNFLKNFVFASHSVSPASNGSAHKIDKLADKGEPRRERCHMHQIAPRRLGRGALCSSATVVAGRRESQVRTLFVRWVSCALFALRSLRHRMDDILQSFASGFNIQHNPFLDEARVAWRTKIDPFGGKVCTAIATPSALNSFASSPPLPW